MVEGKDKALRRVATPANGLLVAGILMAAGDTFVAVVGLLDLKVFNLGQAEGIVGVVGVLLSGIVIFGAVQMKTLKSYGWAMTGSVLALISCCSPCWIVSIPLGIWSLVILSDPSVKAAFPRSGGDVGGRSAASDQ